MTARETGDRVPMQDAISKFVNAARHYCEWAEQSSADTHANLLTVQTLLAELHRCVLILELPDVTDEDASDLVTHQQWEHVRDRFSNLSFNGYWSVFEPLEDLPQEPVYNMLSDDLADIYRDVKEGLMLYEQDKIDDAVWEWRFGFDTHWGRHLTSALYAIHSYFS